MDCGALLLGNALCQFAQYLDGTALFQRLALPVVEQVGYCVERLLS